MSQENSGTPLMEPMAGIFSAIESLLARQLQASTATRTRLVPLHGKSLAIEFTGVGLNLYVHCTDEGVTLSSEFDEEADVIITGSPLAMAAFARSDAQDGIRGGSVKFTGDIGVAQDFQKLFAALSPDFEEELSRLIGDEAAYRVSSVVRDAIEFGKKTFDSFTRGVSAHLTEGGKDVPTHDEMDEFLEDIDRLRADVERAEARVNRLPTHATKD